MDRRCRVEGEHPTGACVDVGDEGEWDRLFVGWPVVMNHRELEFRMYYHALDPDTKKFRVGESASQLREGGGEGLVEGTGAVVVVRNMSITTEQIFL